MFFECLNRVDHGLAITGEAMFSTEVDFHEAYSQALFDELLEDAFKSYLRHFVAMQNDQGFGHFKFTVHVVSCFLPGAAAVNITLSWGE